MQSDWKDFLRASCLRKTTVLERPRRKRSKFTEQQIAFGLKQTELGTPIEEVSRKLGISDATFYNWKKKYGGLGPSELRRLKLRIVC